MFFFFSPKHQQIKLYKYYAFTPGQMLLCHLLQSSKTFLGCQKHYLRFHYYCRMSNTQTAFSLSRWDDAEETGGDVAVQADGIRL